MDRTNKLESMNMTKLVLNMSLPLMVSLLVQSLYNIVDGIFVARLGENALAATSLAFPVQLLMIAVGVGTGVGVNALLSKNIGAKDEGMIGKTAATGVVLALLSTVAFMILGVAGTGYFIRSFTHDPQIETYGIQYLSICMVVCAGSFLGTMYQRFLQSTGDTFDSMVSLIAGALTNIVLDPILIFGLFFFPRMEVVGAAVATVIGQCVSAVVAVWLNKKRNPLVKADFRGFRLEGRIVGQIYRVGLPTIVTQAVGSVMVAAVNAILMPFSATAVAFFGVYYKLQNFLFMPMNGLGQAAIPIIGYSYGAKKHDRIKEAIRTTLPIAIGIALAATVVFLLFPAQLLGLFSPSEHMLELGTPALRIIAPTFALASVTMILGYSMAGLGNGLVNMLGTVIRQLIPFVPLAYLFARFVSIGAVWYAMWISESAAVVFAVLATRKIMRDKGI